MSWLLGMGALVAIAAAPTTEDVVKLARVGEVALSPDGDTLVYTLTTSEPPREGHETTDLDEAAWTVRTQLWMVRDLDGERLIRQLTTGDEDAIRPAFSPDGQLLAFLRRKDDKERLQILPLDGGEAQVIDTGALEPKAFAWAPDGQTLAFTARPPETEAQRQARAREGGVERVGEFGSDGLYTVSVRGGQPVRLGEQERHVSELAFSPDGARLVVTTSASADLYEEMLQRRIELVTLADGSWRPLSEGLDGSHAPRFSPDGTKVAWLANQGTLTLFNALRVAELDGQGAVVRTHNAARQLDPTLEAFAWTSNEQLVALVSERTRTAVLRLTFDGSQVERLGGIADRTVLQGLSPSHDGRRFATIAQSSSVPREPAWFEPGTDKQGIAAHPNDVSGWSLGPVEIFQWKGPGGAALEGVLTWPAETDGPVPLMVYPHGGPDAVSQETFDAWTRYFAGRGYAVLRPNYRGGLGYGRAFYTANRGKLGTIEFGDIEAGVDALVRSNKLLGRVDPDQLVYGGWSWGGYLTAWTIGHTQRYKAAVAGAAVVDVVSQYALSDVNHGVAAQWEYLGDPWRDHGRFSRSNPMLSLHKARTPTLVLHGRSDKRVDFSASMILYRALTDVGCPVELYAYPDEPHSFVDPRHLQHVLQHWADWYDQQLGRATGGAAAAVP